MSKLVHIKLAGGKSDDTYIRADDVESVHNISDDLRGKITRNNEALPEDALSVIFIHEGHEHLICSEPASEVARKINAVL